MLELLDNGNVLNRNRFAAMSLDRLPRYGPNEINICAVVDRQQILDTQIEGVTRQLTQVADNSCTMDAVKCIDDRVKMMTAKLEDQLNKFTMACTLISDSFKSFSCTDHSDCSD